MKFDIDAEVLVRSITSASLGLPRKTLTPILKCLVFEEKRGKLNIIATKGIMTVGVETDIDIEYSNYRVLFDSATIVKIAKSSYGVVSFDCSPRKAIIKSGKSSWTLNLQDATEYPELNNSLNITNWETVARTPFMEALSAVHQAASTDPQRPSLCAVNIQDNEFTAADGMTLHRIRSDFAYPNCKVPSHAVQDVLSLLKLTGSEFFGIRAAKNGVGIKSNNVTMVIGALSEEYPDVSSALLKPTLLNNDIVAIEKEEFLTALSRCSVTSDDVGLVTLELKPGKLCMSSKDQTGSHSLEEMDTSWDSSGKVRVNVRSGQLAAAVKSCPYQNMDLYFGREENSKLPSVLIKCDTAQYAAVVTQVRTDLL